MPDDMLEDAIQVAKAAIEDPKFDFDYDPGTANTADRQYDEERIGGVDVSYSKHPD